MSTERIALFGGTFDPVHLGHVVIADAARNAEGIDRVVFIPCRISPHKTGGPPPAPGDARVAMLRMACRDHMWAVVDEYELEKEGPSFSWETAADFRGRYPDARLYWIMGEDQWESLPRWRHSEKLAEMVEFLVFARDKRSPQPRAGYRAEFFEADHPASSTVIRSACAGGRIADVESWLDAEVVEIMRARKLYGFGE